MESPGEHQLALWAAYPTRTLLLRAAVGALAGAALHLLLGTLVVNRDAELVYALRSALIFGAGLGLLGAATSLWARRQARRGRRVWWLGNPDARED